MRRWSSYTTSADLAFDLSWTHVVWRRKKPQDEFGDVLNRWREHGLVVDLLTSPPEGPPDISWGWHLLHRAFSVRGPEVKGWAWIVFSEFKPASDFHLLWFVGAIDFLARSTDQPL